MTKRNDKRQQHSQQQIRGDVRTNDEADSNPSDNNKRSDSIAAANQPAGKKDTRKKQRRQDSSDHDESSAPRQVQSASVRDLRFAWDLESALNYVVHSWCSTPKEEEEFLFGDDRRRLRISFRLGHAGDVAALARLYYIENETRSCSADKDQDGQGMKRNNEQGDETSITSLEVRLAEGLGDEASPPFVFCLLAFLHDDEDSKSLSSEEGPSSGNSSGGRLAGAVLLNEEFNATIANRSTTSQTNDDEDSKASFNHHSNIAIRVQWLYRLGGCSNNQQGAEESQGQEEDSTRLRRTIESRFWLRLASVGLMLKAPLLVASDDRDGAEGPGQSATSDDK